MSFILDALRKSEHERQVNAGQNTGLLYQVEIKRNQNHWLIPAVLVIAALFAFALIWYFLSRPIQIDTSISKTDAAMSSSSQPQTLSQSNSSASKFKHEKHHTDNTQNKIHESHDAMPISPSSTIESKPNRAPADPLKDLPPLNITGYIHNEQSGTVAMINNQLVHEGDEVSPGLRLIKILDNSAIFSYKGYVFTR